MNSTGIRIALLLAFTLPAMAMAQQTAPVVTVPGTPAAVNADIPSQPAVAVKEVASPAAPTNYGDQAIWALMVSFVIQWLKKSSWFQWITPQSSARLQTQFGFLAAFLTTAGIHFAVSGNILEGGGASITVTGISLNAVKDVAWQWAAQQGWYRMLVKEPKDVTLIGQAFVAPALGTVSESTRSKL
jgi:hypothetical protein